MRTKLLVITLATAVVAAVILGLSVTTRADSGLAGIDARLALMPRDSNLVLALNFDALRRSDLYREHGQEKERAIERHPEFAAFVTDTGLDPRRDLDTLVLATRLHEEECAAVGIVTGRFDARRLSDKLKAERFIELSVEGHTVLHRSVAEHGAEGKDIAISFLGPNAIAFGGERGVQDLLELWKGSRQGFTSDPNNRELLAGLDTGGEAFGIVRTADAWSRVSERLEADGVPPALRSLKSVTALTFSLSVDEDLGVQARALCDKPEDAILVFDALKGMIAMGRLAAQDHDPKLASTLSLAQIHNEGSAVTFSLTLPAEVIEEWHERVEQLRQMRLEAPRGGPQT